MSGWGFVRLEPSGTVEAIEPSGKTHIVRGGDMNSVAGRALLDAMSAALSAPAPTVVEPEPVGKRMTVEELARTDGRFPFVWWREVPPGSLLYLAAPPRTPLTDAEIRKIAVEQASSSFGPADNDDETIDWIFNREDLLIFARAVIAASEGERK